MMRTKEDAHDYRYFSCPDLLPIETAPLLAKVRPLVPELPHQLAARFERDLGVTAYDATVLSSDKQLAIYFEAVTDLAIPGKKVANFIINNLLGTLNERGLGIADCPVVPEKLRALLILMENGSLAANQAKEVFSVLFESPQQEPAAIADRLGFKPAAAGELEALCDTVIANNPSEVAAVQAGNDKLLNFLTGQVMKAASTKPNPKQVSELLRARLQ
jgi:aspartyl-tRNA(Asn)/glutamyl-tRNA(Gln) amidotransferase subunit B